MPRREKKSRSDERLAGLLKERSVAFPEYLSDDLVVLLHCHGNSSSYGMKLLEALQGSSTRHNLGICTDDEGRHKKRPSNISMHDPFLRP